MKAIKSNLLRPALPVVFAAALLLAAGCAGSDGASDQGDETAEAPSQRAVRVETMVVQPSDFEDVIEMTGTVEALDDATLSAQSAGTVTTLVTRGTQVGAGQTIAQLDPGLAQAAVEQAEAAVAVAQAQFDLAEDNFNRQEPLYRDSIISAIEFEQVRTQLAQSRAQLSQARATLAQANEQLKNTRVVAPFAGMVENVLIEKGEQVMPGTPIARLVSTNRVKVTAGVPERYARDIDLGDPVDVSFQAYGGERFPGRVTFVGSSVDPNSRTFPVEVELSNSSGRFKPQMVARLFLSRERLEDVLVLPQTAILRDEEGATVFVVERTDSTLTAERRSLETGSSYAGQAVVLAGIEPGEEVIVTGQTNVTSGDPVNVVERHENVAEATEPADSAGDVVAEVH